MAEAGQSDVHNTSRGAINTKAGPKNPLGRGFGADIVCVIALRLLSFKKCCVTGYRFGTEKDIF